MQEAGAVRPRGMHFCYSQNILADVLISRLGMNHTAHEGQLARFVGSPVMFVALTATVAEAIRNKAETECIMLPL